MRIFRKFESLSRDVLSIDADGMAIEATSQTTRTRHDVAKEIFSVLMSGKSFSAVASKHSRWAAVLRAAIQHTSGESVTQDQWVRSIAGAMQLLGIEWMPGTHRGHITCRRIVQLVGSATNSSMVMAGQPGSLKRAAIEAVARRDAGRIADVKRARRRKIDFGCAIPFTEVPELIRTGFREQRDKGGKVSERVLSHYQVALQCLQECLGDPRCDLLLMLVLTVCSSSERLDVKEGEHHFSASDRPNNPTMLAACLVTRMLWFLRRESFPWSKDEGQVLRVPEMIKKMGK